MNFETELCNFFKVHDPGRIRLSRRIASTFRNNRNEVMHHLKKIYGPGGVESLAAKVKNKNIISLMMQRMSIEFF